MGVFVAEQLARWLRELGSVGVWEEGGLWRQPFSEADAVAKRLLSGWMTEHGLTVRQDAVGNLFGRLDGMEDGPVALVGSHLDSVKRGGIYDGALGILAGLAAVVELKTKRGRPRCPIEVVALCGEEQSRFKIPYMGSRGITGDLTEAELYSIRDADGISVAQAMQKSGLDPSQIGDAVRDDIACFIELHIEQGPTLISRGLSTGVVTNIVGLTQLSYTFHGEAGHGGTTPMHLRRDSLRGAARVIDQIPQIVAAGGEFSVGTVGIIHARPGGVSTIAGETTFTVDVRDEDLAIKTKILTEIDGTVKQVGRALNLQYSQETHTDENPVAMDQELSQLIYGEALAAEISCMRMPSRAGHDSIIMSRRYPTSLVFIACKDGRSHCPEEHAEMSDIQNGATLLVRALERFAYD